MNAKISVILKIEKKNVFKNFHHFNFIKISIKFHKIFHHLVGRTAGRTCVVFSVEGEHYHH